MPPWPGILVLSDYLKGIESANLNRHGKRDQWLAHGV